ncbi:MAG: hypothetical protein H6831_13940 [Planctomycetes bacterium]|nr:hypothetical protein [Planctomycetota bacterium]MCB9905501.1 hypothetical protein [Planctomycetota bacterium]
MHSRFENMNLAILDLAWQADWNATLGWSLVIAGFVWGAVLGLGFHDEDYLGGYPSFRRRLLRLGHVACVALGAFNVFWSTLTLDASAVAWGGCAWALGGVLMPTVCALSAWRSRFRHLFFLPVLGVLLGAVNGLLQ